MTISFDRQAMLDDWATTIEGNYTAYEAQLAALRVAASAYQADPSAANLGDLREAMQGAYMRYQRVDVLLFGKAEEIRLRERSNTYPTDTELIRANAEAASAPNFDLPSQNVAQGFPALDYLLYGLDETTLATPAYKAYVAALVDELVTQTQTASADFSANRTVYVQNDGNSATASIDRTVNDFIFYYEKFFRAGKVGIPAGVFSDDPLADRVESLYGGSSKMLTRAALNEIRDFFINDGLKDYLDALNVRRDGELLSAQIVAQFDAISPALDAVSDNFSDQVTNDNAKMLALYDEMQRAVVLLKVDMLQALGINVDFVDADGD